MSTDDPRIVETFPSGSVQSGLSTLPEPLAVAGGGSSLLVSINDYIHPMAGQSPFGPQIAILVGPVDSGRAFIVVRGIEVLDSTIGGFNFKFETWQFTFEFRGDPKLPPASGTALPDSGGTATAVLVNRGIVGGIDINVHFTVVEFL